jgi:hypothetical protein
MTAPVILSEAKDMLFHCAIATQQERVFRMMAT